MTGVATKNQTSCQRCKAVKEPNDESLPVEFRNILNGKTDLNERYCQLIAERAAQGDCEAAREILDDFIGAISQYSERSWHGAIYYCYAKYLADCFQQILSGKEPALALNLKSSKAGRRKGVKTHNYEALAAAFNLLVRNGFPPEKAKAELRKAIGVDRTTIDRARKENWHFRFPKWIEDEILKVAAKPYAAIISKILTADSRK